MRREKLGPQELLDPPVHVDPLEMMVPRVTLYVSCTKTHASMTDALLELPATASLCHISQSSFLLPQLLLTQCQICEASSLFSMPRCVCRVLSASQETLAPLVSLVLL